MGSVEIAKGIYEVGVRDWNIRDFHGYSTHMGTSYNAYLVVDETIALIDTVKKEYADQLLENISHIVEPQKIDVVISNHTELDHSGSLARLMHVIGENKPIYCSQMGQKNLARHFPSHLNFRAVKEGEQLRLGDRTLSFMETRMVHWPDSMFTYIKEDQILFSSDGFGQHYAGPERYDDQVGDAIMPHAQKYFANILLLYAPLILKLLQKIKDAGLAIRMICPDHGIIWRHNPGKIIEAYERWSRQRPERKAVIVYDTMWHSTEKMARAIATGLEMEEIAVRPMKLRQWHRSDIMTEVIDAQAVVVGSPTLNNGLFPTLADFLCYMKGLKPQHKIGAAFGSYGWSGEAVKLINQELEAMGIEVITPGARVQYVPDSAAQQACIEIGRRIGQAVNKRLRAEEH